MEYRIIDLEHWKRREYFEHYRQAVPCIYSMTVQVDITNIRQKGYKLYPTMLYCLATQVNRHEEFRMNIRPGGQLVCYDVLHPSYTVFHQESETFSSLWTLYTPDHPAFCRRYAQDQQEFGAIEKLEAKPGQPENVFNVSMLPWAAFQGFHLQTQGFDYLLPIFTMGRFQQKEGRCWLPLAIQVHHGVCDGFHVCRLVEELQDQLESL